VEGEDRMEPYDYFAKCNSLINNTMLTIIKNSPNNAYSVEVKGFYKSIGEILDHVYASDVRWLNDFKNELGYSYGSDPLFKHVPEHGERLTNTIDELIEKRTYLDGLIIKMCSEIKDKDLEVIIHKKRKNGQILEKEFCKIILHFFNHQTHHRGQVSQILDAMNIENDYSNMLFIE
jgi:uncharacterized damage-inducible protein DinB